MTALLSAAFTALGPAANGRDVALVARMLRESGDSETLALFPEAYDREALDAVTAVAMTTSAGGFVALDLFTEMSRPPSGVLEDDDTSRPEPPV